MMRRNMGESRFVWDDDKADTNFEKHGVTFDEAMEVFEDPNCANEKDEREDHGEERWKAVGTTRDGNKTLVVVYSQRLENGEGTTRLISAWSVGDRGRRRYGYRGAKTE